MEQRKCQKKLAMKPLNILLIVINIVCCSGIVAILIISIIQKFNNGLWIASLIFALLEILLIWITLETWMYVKIDRTVFELYNYRKVYKCNIDEIEKIELRTDKRGAKYIVVQPKQPIYRQNRKGKKYSDSKREIVLINSPKILKVIKNGISEEKTPYIKNDFYCNRIDQ